MTAAELVDALRRNGWTQARDGSWSKTVLGARRKFIVKGGQLRCLSKYDQNGPYRFSAGFNLAKICVVRREGRDWLSMIERPSSQWAI